jgi:nitroreductase
MSVDEAMTTTRSVHRRLELSRPVGRELIDDCLRFSPQAPNGGNRQDWRSLLLGIPYRPVTQVASGYVTGGFRPAEWPPLEHVPYRDGWSA